MMAVSFVSASPISNSRNEAELVRVNASKTMIGNINNTDHLEQKPLNNEDNDDGKDTRILKLLDKANAMVEAFAPVLEAFFNFGAGLVEAYEDEKRYLAMTWRESKFQ